MSENGWTPEPWEGDTNKVWLVGKNIDGGGICSVAYSSYSDTEATRDRIVACVNGCVGIPKPEGLAELVECYKALMRCADQYRSSDAPVGLVQSIFDLCGRSSDALRACGIPIEEQTTSGSES